MPEWDQCHFNTPLCQQQLPCSVPTRSCSWKLLRSQSNPYSRHHRMARLRGTLALLRDSTACLPCLQESCPAEIFSSPPWPAGVNQDTCKVLSTRNSDFNNLQLDWLGLGRTLPHHIWEGSQHQGRSARLALGKLLGSKRTFLGGSGPCQSLVLIPHTVVIKIQV